MSGLSRRALLGAGASGLFLPSLAYGVQKPKIGARPKNVIFMVADGMSAGTLAMADQLLKLTQNRNSYWRGLLADPNAYRGHQETRSLNSLVTDSAAASSSWGSGRHIWNGALNSLPGGTALVPLYTLLGEKKVRRGLVTTTTMTHATPSGFAISHPTRDEEETIAVKYLASGVEVLMGGGDKFFAPDRRKDGRDLYGDFAKAGYRLARNRDEMMAAAPGNLLGIFAPGQIPYSVDRANSPELAAAVPSLVEMAKTAIDRLIGGKEGFFLQIEGGRVDHAAHSNDLAALLNEQIEFEETLRMVLDFAMRDKETLVVVTTDHGNANPGLMGGDDELLRSKKGLGSIAEMKGSYESFLSAAVQNVLPYDEKVKARQIGTDMERIVPVFREVLGLELSADEASFIGAAVRGQGPLKAIEGYNSKTSQVAVALSNHTHVGWSGNSHTSDHVILSAIGPGAEAFEGVVENISIFDTLLGFKGIKHQNPTMTFEEALKHREKTASVDEEHWS
ncbi:hypothetical protein EON81_16040 [bacterium]|nr:MAG: hypothetical protein EON81_16040 [bacterium]